MTNTFNCKDQLLAACHEILNSLDSGDEIDALEVTPTSVLFTYGGPTIEAIKEPENAHFHLRGHWGRESCEVVDWNNLIPRVFSLEIA